MPIIGMTNHDIRQAGSCARGTALRRRCQRGPGCIALCCALFPERTAAGGRSRRAPLDREQRHQYGRLCRMVALLTRAAEGNATAGLLEHPGRYTGVLPELSCDGSFGADHSYRGD